MLREYNIVAQIQLKDRSLGRHFIIADGKVKSRAGLHPRPDVAMIFKDVDTALVFLNPNPKMNEVVHAAKNFKVQVMGRDLLCVWFMQLLNLMNSSGLEQGVAVRDGTRRYTMLTNGGPLFVFVRDGRILRCTPIDFDDRDAGPWTIRARGRTFSPRRQATVAPHALAMKSAVYSAKRILYPMKRVDFDPNGDRNPQTRGISGYKRITWDEALDLVAGEIQRQKRVHGPGSIVIPMSSHHQWGNVGYYLSSLMRFGNLIGFTRMAANPDSWEGWYWGAMHHWGHSQRVGIAGNYGTVEDCLQEAELMVFWSSDPESTNGAYMGFEGTQRRLWAKELGIQFVHIDPHYNPTAQLLGGRWIPIRPQTDAALAIAIMYVWVVENLYDADYVATRTSGFDDWRRLSAGHPRWRAENSGMAGVRDVGSGQGSARSGQALGREKNLSCGGCRGQRLRGRGARGGRRPMGSMHGDDDGHAGTGQARCEPGKPASRHACGHGILFPRLRRWRHLG